MQDVRSSIIGPRSDSETRAFREACRLLVAFGISSVPATLLLALMGGDFLEGDFGPAGTSVMAVAGGMSILCAVVGAVARGRWAVGRPLSEVLGAIAWPLLIAAIALGAAMFAFAAEFSFLLRAS